MKKLISTVLALIIGVSMLSVVAFATESATVTTELELRDAAATGGEITVSSYIAVYAPIDITKDLTINLGEQGGIVFPAGIEGDYLFNISGATLTVNALAPYGNMIEYNGKGSTYKLSGGSDTALTINGGSHIANLEGGTFAPPTSLFNVVTNSSTDKPVITLNGGSFSVASFEDGDPMPQSDGPLLSGDGILVIKSGNFGVNPTLFLHADSECYYSEYGGWEAVAVSDTYSTEFKKYTNDRGEITVERYEPKTEFDFFALTDYYQMLFDKQEKAPFFRLHSESLNKQDSTLYASLVDDIGNRIETHKIKFVYKYDASLKAQVDALIEKLPKGEELGGGEFAPYIFKVTDLEVVNYWLTCKESLDNTDALINFSDEFKKLIGYKNFRIDCRAGDGDFFYTFAEGIADFKYGDTVLGSTTLGVQADHILYVPDDTANTAEAIGAAAQKRIHEYLGKDRVKLEYVDTIYDMLDASHFANTGTHLDAALTGEDLTGISGVSKDDFCYKVNINDVENYLIVKRGSEKMVTPTYQNVDVKTDVLVTTNDSSVPLDTMLEVEKLTSGAEYERVMKALEVKENNTYDIKLHSASTDSYVTKLESGRFEVRLPITDELSGKELAVYYVDANDKVVEHEVKLDTKKNYAVFATHHFSIYTLAAKGDSPYTQSPATSDAAFPVCMLMASLSLAVITFKKVHN